MKCEILISVLATDNNKCFVLSCKYFNTPPFILINTPPLLLAYRQHNREKLSEYEEWI